MFSHSVDFLALIWPIALGFLCLVAIFFPETILTKTGVLKFSLFDFVSFEHGIERGAVRVAFAILSLVFFITPAFRDYSNFFPQTLNLTVFFDDQGVEGCLQSLGQDDLRKLSIAPDWKSRKKSYIAGMNGELEKANVPFRFREAPGQTSATGEVKIKIRMIDGWGAQLYRIVEAEGSLVHTTEMPGTESYQIVSEFQLIQTESTMIKGTIKDVYLNHGLLITPEFKQLFRLSPTKEVFHYSVIAATRADIFPYVNISETLYLVRQDDGFNVPIAYGLYNVP